MTAFDDRTHRRTVREEADALEDAVDRLEQILADDGEEPTRVLAAAAVVHGRSAVLHARAGTVRGRR